VLLTCSHDGEEGRGFYSKVPEYIVSCSREFGEVRADCVG
jgi:hypothetical protein